ncbi:MAG: sigma-70 family RNA polymerase sigma factor [Anaerolineae bacterium]|nr:sigma-70 family RNA polymerase sigma factor [Anaerolineae bacterium]
MPAHASSPTNEVESLSATETLPDGAPLDPYAGESDQELARRAKSDREAFGLLYERHVAAIYRYVFYRVGNVEDAEDLTARVFARALKHIHNYNDRGVPFTAWLYRIAHNVVANFHRDNSRRPSVPLEEADAFRPPAAHDDHADHDQRIDGERDRARLLQAIRMLPAERQHLIVLKFVEQLQNAEIGQIMNRSEGAIKSLYHRTLLQLREIMDELEHPRTKYEISNGTRDVETHS